MLDIRSSVVIHHIFVLYVALLYRSFLLSCNLLEGGKALVRFLALLAQSNSFIFFSLEVYTNMKQKCVMRQR